MNMNKKIKVLLSGASGLIGSALKGVLEKEGHETWSLTRHEPAERRIAWDPRAGILEPSQLEGFDAVVHLAGESIASRWTAERKSDIRESRVRGTSLLAETLAALSRKPEVFLCASAVGYYGNRGDEVLEENSAMGKGYLPEVCRDWEEAATPAQRAGIRVVNLRTGIVLTPKGGALAQMLLPFKLGMGGPTGSGNQWMSWISLTDEVSAIRHALIDPSVRGPVNLTAPQPVRNRDFAKALGSVLHRPALMPLPGFAVRWIFGEMGQNLLLDGQKVLPKKLESTGFRFSHPDLMLALRSELGKK